jgi:hypothetical protein
MAEQVSTVPVEVKDDWLTVCAISLVAEMVADVVHEGLGHAAVAFLMGAKSGVLSTVAWSSEFDSRLVAAGGTLANLAAGLVFWMALRKATGGSVRWRFFLLVSIAFNLFSSTGYFFFFWRDEFWGLGGGDWWVACALVVAVGSYCGGDSVVSRRCACAGHRAGAVCGRCEGRSGAVAETHVR